MALVAMSMLSSRTSKPTNKMLDFSMGDGPPEFTKPSGLSLRGGDCGMHTSYIQ